jgi:nitroimidazol reductase NimA-like FMN-containing flavoprotein (pyridoxamine 5'-phosphate oxidase superfamily)
MPRTMDDAEWRAFVSEGTRTGKLATTRHDGRPHVVPIWFVLDGDDFVFNTGAHSIGERNATEDELLVRLHADHVLAQADIAGYDA